MTPLDIFGMMIFHVTSKVASQRGIKEVGANNNIAKRGGGVLFF